MEGRNIALDRAIGFYRDKATFGTQPFPLRRNDLCMGSIDLGNNHRNIRCGTVRGIVRDDRTFCFCIGLLKGFDFLFLHINCTEDKIHLGYDLIHLGGVQHNQIFCRLRHRKRHCPAGTDRFFICFPCGARGSSNDL